MRVLYVSRNLRKTESRKNKLEDQLSTVGAKVNELKEKYASFLHQLILLYCVVWVLLLVFACCCLNLRLGS